jgi:hypothetical protein
LPSPSQRRAGPSPKSVRRRRAPDRIDQLRNATGQNLIAASRQAAFEGYRNHGVLTYALLEAFARKDGADDSVRVGALADYVSRRVPAITQELFDERQSRIRRLSWEDFPIGLRQALLTDDAPAIPRTPTHVLIRAERVREAPSADAPGARELPSGFQVRVVELGPRRPGCRRARGRAAGLRPQ